MEDQGYARWAAVAGAAMRTARLISDDTADHEALLALARSTLDGVPIPPLGTAGRSPQPSPGVRDGRRGGIGWDVRTMLVGRDPARVEADAVVDLENGATSLLMTVGGPGVAAVDIPAALSAVHLDMAPVVLSVQGDADELDAARAFVDLMRTKAVAPAAGTNFGADPLGRLVRRRGASDPASLELQVAALSSEASKVGIMALVVDATAAHDLGAAEVGELGYSMAVAAGYLRALVAAGADVIAAANLMEFRYAATADQFLTMTKLRAARALWRRLLELCGVPPGTVRQHQHAMSSRMMLTRYDPWVNVLRGTVAAFGAGVGGADAITVLPLDTALGARLTLGRRLARNTSALLISESHTAQVTDPAGGAYAVEMLTTSLAERGWEEFRRIETAGGIHAAVAGGSLYESFDAVAAKRGRMIADRSLLITGVTLFPDPSERLLSQGRTHRATDDPEPSAWAADFERLRDDGTDAPVFLVTLGPLAEHTARATFAINAFAAAGIRVERTTAGLGTESMVDAFTRSGSDVVCLAGADTAYQLRGADVVSALRSAGATWIILAGRPPAELAPLIDDHVAMGEDLLAVLRRTRNRLQREGVPQ